MLRTQSVKDEVTGKQKRREVAKSLFFCLSYIEYFFVNYLATINKINIDFVWTKFQKKILYKYIK